MRRFCLLPCFCVFTGNCTSLARFPCQPLPPFADILLNISLLFDYSRAALFFGFISCARSNLPFLGSTP
jgi:hypothetical protein